MAAVVTAGIALPPVGVTITDALGMPPPSELLTLPAIVPVGRMQVTVIWMSTEPPARKSE